jgi:Tfp pilus assembly protein PilV
VFALSSRGLSLLEVIIALGLIPVLVLSLFFLFSRSLRLQRQADDVTRASELARRELEALRVLDYARIPVPVQFSGQAANTDGFPPPPYPRTTLDGQVYEVRVDTAAENGGKAVRVQVSWPGEHRVSLETRLVP